MVVSVVVVRIVDVDAACRALFAVDVVIRMSKSIVVVVVEVVAAIVDALALEVHDVRMFDNEKHVLDIVHVELPRRIHGVP